MGPNLLDFFDNLDLFCSITGSYDEAVSLYGLVVVVTLILVFIVVCCVNKVLSYINLKEKNIKTLCCLLYLFLEGILLHYLELFKTQISWLYCHPWVTIVILLVAMTIMSCLKNFVIDIYNKIRNKSNNF